MPGRTALLVALGALVLVLVCVCALAVFAAAGPRRAGGRRRATVGGRPPDCPHVEARRDRDAFRPVDPAKAAEALAIFGGLYTAEERGAIRAAASREQGRAAPWYEPGRGLGGVAYRAGKRASWDAPPLPHSCTNLHRGQRKLFVGELRLLTRLLPRADSAALVVYAGAAPGIHVALLSRLFPAARFELYDPAEFRVRGANIRTHRELFTDEVARGFRGRCDVFISDIRGALAPAFGTSPETEAEIAANMAAQERWTRMIRPRRGAMLKFRPPYISPGADEPLRYIRGRVMWQAWPAAASTETRLVVEAADAAEGAPQATYEVGRYQDACAHHNVVVRPWATFRPPVDGLEAVPGYDRCYDCTNEASAWRDYAALPGAKGPGGAEKGKKDRTVALHMNALTADLGQGLLSKDGHGHLSSRAAADRILAIWAPWAGAAAS